ALRAALSSEEMAELRRVKQRIERERGDLADTTHLDLKIHPGGIMEIEFLAQVLQITAGKTCTPNTLAALAQLAEQGDLTAPEADLLARNYRLFRRLETRLQIVLERSNGLLPLDPDGLAAAAKRLGWSLSEAERRPDQLLADLRARLRAVREIYERRVGLAAGSGEAGP
ncbi:MAG: hypothetical protein HUU35_12450, partial [Armatimonadetes bacterium]|nr:hypothetical protein [Armatimonadota bacterium]